jgi:hypothetical protein
LQLDAHHWQQPARRLKVAGGLLGPIETGLASFDQQDSRPRENPGST